jgi:CTP synthase (UTP-ammonia lyase)
MSRIVVLMDLPANDATHRSMIDSLTHARDHLGVSVEWDVTKTNAIGDLGDAVVIGPGSPYLDPRAAEAAITQARERRLPLVAI